MNFLKSTLVRISLAVLFLAAGLAPAASAQPLVTSTFRIFVDQDPSANTGCVATTTLGTVLTGIDQVVTITFQYTPAPTFTGVSRQACSGGTFGAPLFPAPTLAFGATAGVGGSTGIETSVPLPAAPTGNVRLYFDSIYTGSTAPGNRDELISLNGVPSGPPILVGGGTAIPIPTLGEWGLILLALLLTASGFLVIRRRGDRRRVVAGVLLLLLGLGAGVAWAAELTVDGNTSDWNSSNSTRADDVQPPDAQPNADIVAGFGGLQGSTLFLRLDVRFSGTPVSNRPPVVNGATFSLPENSPNGTVVGTVTFSDPDAGQNHTFTIVGGNTGGAFAIDSSGQITVANSAALDFETTPTFNLTVQVTDDGTPVQSGTGTVTINLTNVDDVNPTAVNDAATVAEDSAANPINVLANDTDADGGPKSISAVTQPANGTVAITGGGSGLTYTPNANYCNSPSGSPDTFTYTLAPGSSSATVTVTVTCSDDAPVAVADAATVAEDSGASPIPVLANDTDVDGGPKSVASVTQPANGTVAITGGGTGVTYTPNANYCNSPSGSPDTFTYTLAPGGSTATVSVTVTCVDDAPVAVNDSATVTEDSSANPIDVLANDTDSDAGPKSVASVTQPANGTVTITGGGTGVTYTPNANYCNSVSGPADTFTYTLTPGSSTATVSVTVTCVDDNPTAVADATTVAEDSGANPIDVLANDTDPDGGPKSVASVTQPANGTVVITGGGTGVTYTPNANYCNGVSGPPDSFTYTLAPGGSSTTVLVTVTCVDDPPAAVNDAATVAEDSGPTAIDVLANDTDIDGGPKQVQSVTQPANGTVAITGGGTGVTYTPNANYCNSPSGSPDTFTYMLAPGGSTATVSVTVTCVNDAPVLDLDADDSHGTTGSDFAVTFTEGTPAVLLEDPVDATVTDVDNTTLASLTVTITNVLDPGSETLSADVTGTSITAAYVPATGVLTLTGPDTVANFQTVLRKVKYQDTDVDPDTTPRVIHFVANDGTANSNTATSTVTIVAVDTPPTAVNDAATVGEDSGANPIDVLANDTDPDNGPKSVASVTQPAHGTVTITGGGSGVSYTPNADYCNSVSGPADTFTYTLTPGSSSATVSVTVTCVDDPPVAVADAATVVEDSGPNAINVLANDTDPDGGPKSIASVTQPAHGTVVITGGGSGLTYAPNADYCNSVSGPADTFTYTLTPGSSSTTVTVTVTCVDDNPVAVADAATVVEDSGANAINVLANDTDVDGGPKSVASVTQPAHGVVVITGGGTGLTYAPNADYCNSASGPADTFTYTLAPGGSSTTVTVTVTCVDDPPVAVADAATVVEDSSANAINVLANDTDVDGGPKSVAAVTQPANGTVVITGGGTGLTYTPNANYCNSVSGPADTFTYTLTPGSSSTTVSVTVTCVDDNPVAVADSATVVEDSGANAINVLANDTDVDGGPKSIASVTQPANGTVVITGGGTGLTYAPNANYCNSASGTPDTFTYTLSPGGSSTTVSVTVTCVDDNPVAVADAATVVEDSGANAINVLANDTDVDGGPKSVGSVTQPANGAVAITGGGTGVSYTPNANYCNSPSGSPDTFTYTLTPGGSSTTVSVTVTCVDDPPVAVADSATVVEDSGANAINVLANDTDVDGGPKSVASVTQPANGAVAITGGGTGVSYTPNANYCNNPPGTTPDTFTYTLTPGGSSTTVSVSVTCVNDPPVLANSTVTYTTPGNTQLHVAGATRPGVAAYTDSQSVLTKANPSDVDGPGPLQVVAASGTSANGGSYTINADGSFSYVPPVGFTGTDTFTYSVTDNGSPAATTTGTVSITVGQRVWYIRDVVDANNPAGGDGRSTNAFDSIAAYNAATTNNGDIIFIFRGNTGTTPLAGGITLKDGQKLYGEGIGLNVPGFGQLVPAGLKPKINNTSGDAVSVPATAGNRQNVEVRGLDLQGSGNAVDVTASGANIVGVTISDNNVSGAGLEGIDLNAGSTGAFTATLDNNAIGATGNAFDARTSAATTLTLSFTNNAVVSNATGILIDGSGGGATTITGFANNAVSGNTVGTGISITSAKFDATPGGGYQTVSGGTTVVGASGNGVGASGVVLANVTGDLAFTDLDIFADGGAGLRMTGTGAVNTGAGTGTRVTVGAGVAIFEAVGGPAVDVTNATIDLQPTSIKSTNSPTTGVALNSVGGTFAAGSGSSISNITSAAGTAFQVGSSNAAISYAGTINTTTGKGVDLTSNTGSTIGFTGTMTLSTGTSTAFNATGGGTVTATDTSSTLTTTTATALNVANTTIGASGLKFRSISAGTAASGPASGIVLNNTGSSGGLTVSGTGSAGSGGAIQKATGAGISLTSTSNVSLTNLNVQNGSTIGLLGSSVTGMTLSSVNITNNGTGAADDNLQIANLLGTVSFTNITVTGAQRNNVFIDNTSSTPLSSFTVTGSNFSNNSAANGNTLFLFQARLTSTVTTASISGSTFSSSKGTGLQVITADTATVSDFTVSGNTFSNNNNHMDFDPAGASSLTVKVLNNGTAAAPLTGSSSQAINFFTAPASTGGTFNVRVQGNYVGNAGTAGSGSTLGNCIRVNINGNMHANVLLDGNVLRQCPNGRGIEVIGRDGIGSADVTVTNNDANPNDVSGFPLAAIFVQSNCVGPCNTVRTDVRGNMVPAGSATGEIVPTFIALAETSGAPSPPGTSTLQLVDTAPASANCTAQLTSTNTGSASANAGCSLIAGPITTPP